MIQIQAPDGSIVEFPDGTDDATITSVMAKSFPAPQQQAPQQQDQRWGWQKALDNAGLQTLKDATQGVAQGITGNWSDELFSYGMAPFGMIKGAITGEDAGKSFGQRFTDNQQSALKFNRDTQKQAAANSPIANTIGQVTGGVMTAGNLAKGGVTLLNAANPTIGNMALRGAAEGALYGAAYGAGEGEGLKDKVGKSLWGMGTGAALGGLTGAVTGAISQRSAQKTIPTAAQRGDESKALYKFSDDSGLVLDPTKYSQTVDDMFTTIASKGFDHQMHPKVNRAFERLQELKNQPLTLQTTEQMRRLLGSAAGSTDRHERMLAKTMIEKMDDYVASLNAKDVIVGNPKVPVEQAAAALNKARELWGIKTQSEKIARLIQRAEVRAGQYSQSGMDNALRTEFRQLAMNDAKMRGFSPEVKAAIEKVAKGTPTENALRLVGKLAPRGPVSFLANASTAVANPVLPFVTAAAGEAGKRSAAAMTQNNARAVDALIRSGGHLPQAPALSPAQRIIIDSLLANQNLVTGRQQSPVR